LRREEIHARKYFYPLTSDQACFKNKYKNKNLEVARKIASEILVLPLYENLERKQMERILRVMEAKMEKHSLSENEKLGFKKNQRWKG
jgi:dTDP-4-amino-4,6-dideoxygalactose transaminase